MRHLLTAMIFLAFTAAASGQFRMVSNTIPNWSVVDDSTYTANVSFSTDQTGMGYLANQIVDTFRLFTGTEQLYRVSNVANTTFSSAELTIVAIEPTTGSPTGQIMVFNPEGRETIPQTPFGNTGATAQIQAAVDTWNARIRGESGDLIVAYTGIIYDTLSVAGSTAYVVYEGGSGIEFINPAPGHYRLKMLKDTHLHQASIFGNNSTLNASQEMLIQLDNTDVGAARRASVQLYDANNNALVDQQATGTVQNQAVSGVFSDITIPGLNGFGGTGFFVEIR
jgi:hypothetical protein